MNTTTKNPHMQAKLALIEKGWTQRAAAPVLGVCYQHLNEVLNGGRHSRRLFSAIAALPQYSTGGAR